ncbi:hypothetical protein LWI28_016091 [Acer negundo]|uniref:Uncharacterized protein n=1 Tax=Acer negundo TaxID=4023 RepID=A0AAD5J5T5_ACENE|nr:hypothetical protein LWI28_016091 [Acer negundo]
MKVQKSNESLKKDIDKLEKVKKEVEEKALKESNRVALLEKGLKKSNKTLVEIDQLCEELKKQLTTIAVESMCVARVKLFRQYLAGSPNTEGPTDVEGDGEIDKEPSKNGQDAENVAETGARIKNLPSLP